MRRLMVLAALLAPLAANAEGVTAARTLPAGTVIGPGDLLPAPGGDAAETEALIGLQTRFILYAGRPVTPAQLQMPRLIARNQIAPLVYRSGALLIETSGRALSEGSAGEVIAVMTLDTHQTVSALIAPDGSLQISR
ncbi:flagellar basal body P-ring formation chaperone FlgA [uncultured Paracoccus sp.]|uniref:flagellar basal body P-ring formation chaperone FlgA n=1 Tax=uncultured Paracoccus sp. TaxID=189685 RepID=UPI00260B8B53|nr:flagellar basal body P-ring formation chaperone FlgA [uncultured Paracoccus sp.]